MFDIAWQRRWRFCETKTTPGLQVRASVTYHGRIMARATNPIPEGFRTLTPHLTVKGGAAKFLDFIQRAFDAVVVRQSPDPAGKLMHAHARIGDSDLMLNDDFLEFGGPPIAEGDWPIVLHLYVPDSDAVFNQAVAAGCEVIMALEDQFWGDRYGVVKDPFGFKWAIATHIEDLTPEEIREREAKLFGGQGD